MTGMPWHFEELGLSAHADLIAVRRAYAQRLRAIDAAANPAAFERLRAAYDAARAWCEQHEAVPPAIEPSQPTEPREAEACADQASTVNPAAPTPDQAAADALAQLRTGLLRASGDEGVRDLLQLIVGTLRFGYVDAPGQFEDMLVDAVRGGDIARRAALFDAAATVLHWDEVGRLHGSDEHASWVARVLIQRETWEGLGATWRMTWFALMAQAKERIDGYVATRWPDIARLRSMLPDWITLHLTPAQMAAWEAAFNDLPPRQRDKAVKRAAPATTMQPPHRRVVRRPDWRRALGIVGMLALLASLLYYTTPSGNRVGAAPLPHFGGTAPTLDECHALYTRLDGPAPFEGATNDDIVQIKRRAQRCALDGHWQGASR
jgi:hypothetical protein